VAVKTRSISGVVFAKNGRQLLISGLQPVDQHLRPTLELANIQTGSAGKLVSGEEGTVSSVALSPNGQMLAFQSDAATIKLLETRDWGTLHTFAGISEGGDSKSESITDRASRRFVLSVKTVLALAFSADGKIVTGEVEQSGIKLWDARTGEVKKELTDQDETNSIVGISANGATAAEIASDETLRLWNLTSGKKETVSNTGRPVSAIALSADGQTVALASAQGIALVNSATRDVIRIIAAPPDVKCLSFSGNGRELAIAGSDGTIKIWDLESGQLRRTMMARTRLTALAFAPGDQILATAGEDGVVSLWNLAAGVVEKELKKHSAAVNAISFSANGQLMATGGDDRTVIIWETISGKPRRSLKGHDLTVTSLAFSPDGSLLASGSGNASVVLWDVPTGKLNRILR
jgi:WD40 repeat protein